MLDIVITSHDLEQLGECKRLLFEILKSQQHTQSGGYKVPQETVDTWDKVQQQCDTLCRHWEQAREQKEGSTKMFNLFTSSKAKESIKSLQSILERERKLEVAIDDVRLKERWEAKLKEGVRMGNEQICRYQMMKRYGGDEYPKEWSLSPGVEAYRVLSTLLRLTKKKGWITDNEIGTLMSDSELVQRAKIFHEHMRGIKSHLECQSDNVKQATRAELREQISAKERDRVETLYGYRSLLD